MTVHDLLKQAVETLRGAGIENAAFEAACLYEKHFSVSRSILPAVYRDEFAGESGAFFEDVKKRAAGEPLQYLLGEWEFMGFPFAVGPGVLIPRPDTEILAETAVEFLRGKKNPRLLDLCFGSGCIGISCALLLKNCRVTGVEISPDALRWAQKNIGKHGLGSRAELRQGDMLAGPDGWAAESRFDFIVCNPPYIPTRDIAGLDGTVRDYEPREALDGGEDGLKFYRALVKWLPLLEKGGVAACEVGIGEAGRTVKLLRSSGLKELFIRKDYGGIERVVGGVK